MLMMLFTMKDWIFSIANIIATKALCDYNEYIICDGKFQTSKVMSYSFKCFWVLR